MSLNFAQVKKITKYIALKALQTTICRHETFTGRLMIYYAINSRQVVLTPSMDGSLHYKQCRLTCRNIYCSHLIVWGISSHKDHVTHICVSKLSHHWFKQWLVAWPVRSHDLNQCWIIVDWTVGNKRQWNLNQNSSICIQENAFKNVVWKKMAAILSRPQWVKRFTCNQNGSQMPPRWNGFD